MYSRSYSLLSPQIPFRPMTMHGDFVFAAVFGSNGHVGFHRTRVCCGSGMPLTCVKMAPFLNLSPILDWMNSKIRPNGKCQYFGYLLILQER